MRPAFLIAVKDLRERVRDRSAFLIAVVAPLTLAAILSLTIGSFGGSQLRFPIAVVDLDKGAAAEAFVSDVLEPAEQLELVELTRAQTREQGRKLADDGEVAATIVLPAGLSLATVGGKPVTIEVLGDVNSPVGTLVARSLSDSFSSYARTIRISIAATGAGPAAAARIGEAVSQAPAPVNVSDVSAGKKELDPKTYYGAAMAVFFLFFTVQYGISSLMDERRDGTLARMLAAPIRRSSVLFGKAGTSLVLGSMSMTVLALATRYMFGARWGAPLPVATLIVAGVLAATAITAAIMTLARTSEQAAAWLSVAAVVLGMLGGSFFPVAQAGGLLERLSLITPHAWFLRGLQELQGGAGFGAILTPLLVLLAIAGGAGLVASMRIRRLIEP